MPRVVGILLAAGASRRFGANKLLAVLADGTPLAVASARRLVGVLAESIAVVRPGDAKLVAMLKGQGLGIVECAQAEQGMGHSLAAGIAAARDADAWLIMLADMPYIQDSTLMRLVGLLEGGSELVAPFYKGQRGHPVGFAAKFGAELLTLRDDSGAREVLSRHAASLTHLDVDDTGVLADVDTPADLRATN